MLPAATDYYRLLPEILAAVFGTIVMLLEPFLRREHKAALSWLGMLGAAAALGAAVLVRSDAGPAFFHLIQADPFTFFLRLLIYATALLVMLAARAYLDRENLPHGEFYALVLLGSVGMGVMAAAAELVTVFIGLEISSLSTYILASYRREALRANESALKYFLLGSFATAFFLFGVALVYGATGTARLEQVAEGVASVLLLKLGLALVFIGLAFKVASAPFHVWTPDVYEGAPAPVTALLSTAPKAAAFAVLLRIAGTVLPATLLWFWVLWGSAALTMFVGNLAALVQSNVKRMLAYSSIAHAGYILVALAAGTEAAYAAALYYLAAYALMKLGAFTLVAHLAGRGERRLTLEDYAGLARREPVVAATLSLYLLSLLGLPLTAGFLGKFYVFVAGLRAELLGLVVLAAVNTLLGAYYYLRVILYMYFREPDPTYEHAAREPVPAGTGLVLAATAAGTLLLGIFPGHLMRIAELAAASFR
ncbi:MAG: NADH-quinone oxidoreductase subunit N [Acidobacteriia bacterium]|jgi:NADH-quinone oxidoreductase subunit N|nr:NADH-quinone oxidoreductase subunit N [Terriglobia bacterium]